MTKLIVVTTVTASVLLGTVRAADDLPQRPEFARYEAMMTRSPFAVATAAAAAPVVSNFAKDLYIANAAHSPNGDLVTVASSTDKNLKLYLSTAEPVDGYSISNIEWSERVGSTKVTITKDGQFATIGFNQALLSAPLAASAPPPMPVPATIPQMPQVPQPGGTQPQIQGAPQGFGAPNSPAATGGIKPAPVPMLPTPPPRVRSVIPRNPGATPAPGTTATPAEL
jgi:hypothetical protein